MSDKVFEAWTTTRLRDAYTRVKEFSRDSQRIKNFQEKYHMIASGVKSKNKGANPFELVDWFNGESIKIYKDHYEIKLDRMESGEFKQSALLVDLMADVSKHNKFMYTSMKEILDALEWEEFYAYVEDLEHSAERRKTRADKSSEEAKAFKDANKKLEDDLANLISENERNISDISSMKSRVKAQNNKLVVWNLIASVAAATLIFAAVYVDKDKCTECLNLLT